MSSLPTIDENRFEFKNLSEKDLPLLYSWVNQPEVAKWWYEGGSEFAIFQAKYKAKLNSNNKFPFIVYLHGTPIGYVEYYIANQVGDGWWPDQPDGVYGIDIFIGVPEKLGKGYGSIFLRMFVDLLFAKPEVKKIIIDPAIDNLRAIRCYEKVGFRPVGRVMTPIGPALLMEFQAQACSYMPASVSAVVLNPLKLG